MAMRMTANMRVTKEQRELHRAMDLLRQPMIQTNIGGRCEYGIVPRGGRVETKVAELIKKHPQIIGSADALWPGLSQTWRIAT
jgi:hypothetical protein